MKLLCFLHIIIKVFETVIYADMYYGRIIFLGVKKEKLELTNIKGPE